MSPLEELVSPSVRDGRDSAVDTIHAVWLPAMVDDLDDFEGGTGIPRKVRD